MSCSFLLKTHRLSKKGGVKCNKGMFLLQRKRQHINRGFNSFPACPIIRQHYAMMTSLGNRIWKYSIVVNDIG